MSASKDSGYFDAFEEQENPLGHCIQGFFEEYQLTRDGPVEFEMDFLPRFQLFLKHFPKGLPRWSEFINLYRHFIGLAYTYPQAPHHGAVVEGFRFDFDLNYDPCWLAVNDLDFNIKHMPPLSRETLFWLALQVFYRDYRYKGDFDFGDFVRAWHKFLRIEAVCYSASALSADYAEAGISSYQLVYDHFFSDQESAERYKERLREFVEEMIIDHDYFLPTHHFNKWIDAMTEDYEEFQELLKS